MRACPIIISIPLEIPSLLSSQPLFKSTGQEVLFSHSGTCKIHTHPAKCCLDKISSWRYKRSLPPHTTSMKDSRSAVFFRSHRLALACSWLFYSSSQVLYQSIALCCPSVRLKGSDSKNLLISTWAIFEFSHSSSSSLVIKRNIEMPAVYHILLTSLPCCRLLHFLENEYSCMYNSGADYFSRQAHRPTTRRDLLQSSSTFRISLDNSLEVILQSAYRQWNNATNVSRGLFTDTFQDWQ